MAEHSDIAVDPKEEKFRKESRWLSFKSAAWGAVGMATFFGALSTVAAGVIAIATGIPATVAGGIPTAAAALLGGAMPLIAIGGMMAFGAFSIYMSQHEGTELEMLRSEHQAEQNARCMSQDHSYAPAHAPAQEYEQNVRKDGKQWGQVVNMPQHQHAAAGRTN